MRLDVQLGNPVDAGRRGRRARRREPHRRAQRSRASTDYTGELQADTTLRITDANNGGAGGADPATVSDVPLRATMRAPRRPAPTIGGDCSVSTSLDALVPGTITESDRSIWQLGEVTVFDGGSDGVVSTSPNTVLARQGIFVP